MRRGVHLFHVDFCFAEIYRVHAAADIDTDHIGYRLVPDSHGGADGAAFPGVDIGHNADSAALSKRAIAHSLNLLDGRILDNLCITESGIYFSFDFHHCSSPVIQT